MTAKVPLSFACASYDRMEALRGGEVRADGIDLNFITIDHPRDIFDRMMGGKEFDASEMSSSEYIRAVAAGECDLVALPVFPSKVFRHGFIAVNSDHVFTPKDLEGKKVGVQLYTMSAAVWIRGLLAQEGVELERIEWVEGAMERPGVHGKPASLPPGKPVRISKNKDPHRGLSQLLEDGELAATIGADLPAAFGHAPNIRRLFPDFKEAEKRYYRRHGIFPIMHLVVVKRAVAEAHPWLPSSLFNAFNESKDLALRRMRFGGTTRYMLPWMASELDEIREVFGDKADPWAYGLEENRKTLETAVDFLYDQGMIERKPTLGELFWPVAQHWNI